MCWCWDTLLCCFGCLTLCGCRNNITKRLVFFPPKTMYTFTTSKDKQTMYLLDEDDQKALPVSSPVLSLHTFTTARRQTIAAFYIRRQNASFTVLFSHGNATDLGCMRDHLIDLAERINVNVFAYDYSGYGMSSGECSVSNCEADIEAAFQYLTEELDVSEKSIILYGQSLGSGPSCYLAARRSRHYRRRRKADDEVNCGVAGVILHSPLTSGIRVVRPDVRKTFFFDIFPNIDRVREIDCPVFIIHGDQDREIPVSHGKLLYENSKKLYNPWFVEGAGHNDIEFHWRDELFQNIDLFISHLSIMQSPPSRLNSVSSPVGDVSSSREGMFSRKRDSIAR